MFLQQVRASLRCDRNTDSHMPTAPEYLNSVLETRDFEGVRRRHAQTGLDCLNQTPTLCMPYRFEPGVNIEFGENVFDVIVNGGRADVQSVGNYSGAVALC